NQEGLFRGR
nr:RecName: Full=Fibrinogen beta chain; Contains: RecName: Full=Fibrinopeptide B [Papio anubis]prf//1001180A fibrinopeptide A [Papio anubis]